MRISKRFLEWLIVANIVIACGIIFLLIPVTRTYFVELSGMVFIEEWPREPYYIAAWERELSREEADELLGDLLKGFYRPVAMEHLIRHANEPLVVEALRDATQDENPHLSLRAEYVLFRAGHEADERWALFLHVLETGGLDEEHLSLLRSENVPEDESLAIELNKALWARDMAQTILCSRLTPELDSDRVPDLLRLLQSEDRFVRETAIWALGTFNSFPDARSALAELSESDPDKDLRQQALWALESEPRYHWDYEAQVQQNRRGFVVSILLIGAIIVGSVVLVRLLARPE